MRHASQGASCCSGPLHCLGAERSRRNHRSAWLELWNAPFSYQTHQAPPSPCQIPWDWLHHAPACGNSLTSASIQTRLSSLRLKLSSGLLMVPLRTRWQCVLMPKSEGLRLSMVHHLDLPCAFQDIYNTTNMWSIHPDEGSTRQIYRVTDRCNWPCNIWVAPVQPLP